MEFCLLWLTAESGRSGELDRSCTGGCSVDSGTDVGAGCSASTGGCRLSREIVVDDSVTIADSVGTGTSGASIISTTRALVGAVGAFEGVAGVPSSWSCSSSSDPSSPDSSSSPASPIGVSRSEGSADPPSPCFKSRIVGVSPLKAG